MVPPGTRVSGVVRVVLALLAVALLVPEPGAAQPCVDPCTSTYSKLSSAAEPGLVEDLLYYFKGGTAGRPPAEFTQKAPPNLLFTGPEALEVAYVWEDTGYVSELGWFRFTESGGVATIVEGGPNNLANPVGGSVIFRFIRDKNSPNSGTGCLTQGDSIITTKVFQAGDRVGFYLAAGKACGQSTDIWYSVESLNSDYATYRSRHVATYIDANRELMILGWEDLSWANMGNDKDYNDGMFVFNTRNAQVSFDGYPFACTDPVCKNGNFCNYTTGNCDCPSPWSGSRCEQCGQCDDSDPCTTESCFGACNQTYFGDTCPPQGCNAPTSITACDPTTGTTATTGTTGSTGTTGTTTGRGAASASTALSTTGAASGASAAPSTTATGSVTASSAGSASPTSAGGSTASTSSGTVTGTASSAATTTGSDTVVDAASHLSGGAGVTLLSLALATGTAVLFG